MPVLINFFSAPLGFLAGFFEEYLTGHGALGYQP